MSKVVERTCNLCEERLIGNEQFYLEHGEECHPGYYLNGFKSSPPNPQFKEKNYFCPLDNKWYYARKWLARTITKHGLTNAEYYQKYGKEFMPKEWHENEYHDVLGNAHNTDSCKQCDGPTPFVDGKWSYPAFCGSQCSTTWYAENTNRVDRAMETLRERKEEDPDLHLRPNQHRYWVVRGYSDEEATELVRERQATNSLSRFKERYGPEEGERRFALRQERWLESLKKSRMYQGYSNISISLFSKLDEVYGDLLFANNEKKIRCGHQVFTVDCIRENRKKIIEFFGDYWHANPDLYEADEFIKRKQQLASEIWEWDKTRITLLEERGYQVLIVWEKDYRENPEEVINRCIEFLK